MKKEESKKTISNILIAFSMLVGMVFTYIIESMWNPPGEWVVIDIKNVIDIVNVGIDITLYAVSIIIAHPLTMILFVGFMVWFRGRLNK